MKKILHNIIALVMSLLLLPFYAWATDYTAMNNFCVTPPFIQESIKPNLLFLIDNSSSMFDLTYVDKGKLGTCSTTTSTACLSDTGCPSGQTCNNSRQPYYCYDETYQSGNTYVGYFNRVQSDGTIQYYTYDFVNNIFNPTASYSCTAGAGETAKSFTNHLCVIYNPALAANAKVTKFLASGNYLNWLTASKLDVEKQVLTGGKYVTKLCSNDSNKACTVDADCGSGNTCNAVANSFLQKESRGCVGQGYVKQAITADFVNYVGSSDSNTSLQVTFRVRGPGNANSPSAPSNGGQTYIDIFAGATYDYSTCQAAINALATGTNAEIKQSVADCLSSTAPEYGTCQQAPATACLETYGPTTPNCDPAYVGPHCSSKADTSCATDANCIIAGSRVCSNQTKNCAADGDCTIPQANACSGDHARSCSTDSNCAVAAVTGHCSGLANRECTAGGSECDSGNKGPCVGASSAQNYGTCSFIVTAGSTGTCQAATTVDYGPCVPASGGYVGPCVLSPHATLVKTKVAFQQSMQACWALRNGHAIGIDDINTVKNQCTTVYAGYKTCSNNSQQTCTSDANCGAGTCQEGPSAIGPGNWALLCGISYEGQFYEKVGGVWSLKASATEADMEAVHTQFCNDLSNPNVVDPTDSPSDTATFDNIPAILSGIGVEAQMGAPLSSNIAVRVKKDTAPTGLVQDYSAKIRMGVMSFNYNGSKSEVTAGSVTAPKVCSNNAEQTCTSSIDCGTGNTCGAATNRDGGKILYYIGQGSCSTTTSTRCAKDAHCPDGETCVSAGVGDHTTGMVNAIDGIRAASWTPFAEAFYNAIGYFAVDTTRDAARFRYSRANAADAANNIRLDSNDFADNMNPSQYVCQANNILLISDGSSTMDQNSTVNTLAGLYHAPSNQTGACSYTGTNYYGSKNLDDLAWLAKNRNINTFSLTSASTVVPAKNQEAITTFVVFNGASNGAASSDECNSETLLTRTAANGGTTLYTAEFPDLLRTKLSSALDAVSANATSGTAASILSNSEGSGASLLQALFYPKKEFDKLNDTDSSPTSVKWVGELQNYWYYLDPFLQKTSIREDSVNDYKLNLKSDKVIQFYFDPVQSKTLVNKYSDLNGDGAADSTTPDTGGAGVAPETIKSLWQAGRKLWERNVSTAPRTIYTGYNSTSGNTPQKFSNAVADDFNTDTSTAVWNYLQIPSTGATSAQRKALATKIINYIYGTDQADDAAPCLTSDCKYRSRKVQINNCGLTDAAGCYREWKLGDIVSSTPKIVSNVRLNNYDLPVPLGYNDSSYGRFVQSSTYQNRGMAFVGANDGMLHAFKLGILHELKGTFDKAQITNTDGTIATSASNLGKEEWGFIPRQTLPYLKYLPETNYNHIFYVDRSPQIVDASIGRPSGCADGTDYSECAKSDDGSTWRTILISGTGIGGASREQTSSFDSVKPPIANFGYSSYFALDVTDPVNPKYMWEFFGNTAASGATPTPKLGFSTTGPAIVRISAKVKNADGTYSTSPDHKKNGKWFGVFASGPLGPIDTANYAFKGESEQQIRIFIVDIATGALVRTIECGTSLGLTNAFAGGALASSVIDTERGNANSSGHYSDDAIYVGYVQKDLATGTWTKGGVIRILTKEDTNPNNWSVSKFIDGIGPVTTSVTKLQDRKNSNMWLFFGTGRFFYKNDDISTTRQAIYGVKEPCYSTLNRTMQTAVAGGTDNRIDKNCTDIVSGTLVDQSAESAAPASTLSASAPGWKILLDAKDNDNSFLTERIITDPVAAQNGAVFFTSFRPSSDLCKFGGDSLLWAVRYDTGSTPPASAMQGKALMQVSTGAFAEIKLSDAFKNPGSTRYDGRRLATPITGVPPTAQGLSLFSNPPPTKKLLHVREK